jgi:hypothetical protein
MSTSYSPKIVTNGLVFFLDSSNPKSLASGSKTSWIDLSANKYTCTFSNLSGSNYGDNFSTSTGSIPAIVMNTGSVGYGVITTGLTYSSLGILTNGYTFESVVNLNGYANSARAQGALFLGAIGSNQGLAASYNTDNVFSFTTFYTNTASAAAGVQATAASIPIQSGSWYHVTGVVEVSPTPITRIYINGVQMSTNSSYSGFSSLNNGTLSVGGTSTLLGTSPNQYEYAAWNGSISFSRIYNRPLTPAEVLQNFTATKGRFGL